LYKEKFSQERRESYKLNSIADEELGYGKLEHDGSFKEFYKNHFKKFVKYNIHDVKLLVELDKPVNLALLTSGSNVATESITGAQFRTCRYIVWKHVPDETNVMLRYNPQDQSIVENGLLYPQYLDPVVRDNSGNVVKALKQQNLIQ
jgi:hypothetical protein